MLNRFLFIHRDCYIPLMSSDCYITRYLFHIFKSFVPVAQVRERKDLILRRLILSCLIMSRFILSWSILSRFDIVMIQRSRIVVLFPFDRRVCFAWCLLLGRLGHWHIRLQIYKTGKSRNSRCASGGGVGA